MHFAFTRRLQPAHRQDASWRRVHYAATSLCLALAATAYAQPAAPIARDGSIRIERFHVAGHGSVNSWLIIGRQGVAVVDAQRSGPEATALVARIKDIGKPLESIVLTHEHPDHIGGLDVLVRAFPEASIVASAATTQFIRDHGPGMVKAMQQDFGFGDRFPDRIPVPTKTLRAGQSLRLGDWNWTVQQWAEGEAMSMTVLVAEGAPVALVADLAGNRMTPWMADGHVRAWLRQLDVAMVQLAGRTVFPGHGEPGPAGEVLQGQRQYLSDFLDAVQREMAGSKGPLSEVSRGRIRLWADARYAGWPRVAPPPNLIEINADAVAKELSRIAD